MTGAIEFLKAWRDICDEEPQCNKCPIEQYCKGLNVDYLSDKTITELVRSVMAQSRKAEREVEQ